MDGGDLVIVELQGGQAGGAGRTGRTGTERAAATIGQLTKNHPAILLYT